MALLYNIRPVLLLLAALALVPDALAQAHTSAIDQLKTTTGGHYASPDEVRAYRARELGALTKSVAGDGEIRFASLTGGGDLTCLSEGECVDVELIEIETSTSGAPTYTFRITSNCDKSLSYLGFLLPGVLPTSWSSTASSYTVEVDVNHSIHFIKFEFGGDIKNGDEIEVSYTLPNGVTHSLAILGAAKLGRHTEGFAVKADGCGDSNTPCVQYSKNDLRNAGTHIVGGDATIVIPSDACDLLISVSSYELPGGSVRPFEDQILFDNVTNTYGPGTHHVSVDLPDCAWQSDVYLGDVVPNLIPGVGHPPDRIIAWDYLEDTNRACECIAEVPTFDGELIKDGNRRLIEVTAPGGVSEIEFYNTANLIVVGVDGPDASKFDRTGDSFTWDTSEGAPPVVVRFELEPEDKSNSNVRFFIRITDRCDQTVDVDPIMDLGGSERIGDFVLHPAFPNPFNPQTQIRFDLPEASNVSLVVYDLMGREVATLVSGHMDEGTHEVTWDSRTSSGEQVASGVYMYRIDAGEYSKTMHMTVLK